MCLLHLTTVNDAAATNQGTYTYGFHNKILFLRTGTVFSLKMVQIYRIMLQNAFNVRINKKVHLFGKYIV